MMFMMLAVLIFDHLSRTSKSVTRHIDAAFFRDKYALLIFKIRQRAVVPESPPRTP